MHRELFEVRELLAERMRAHVTRISYSRIASATKRGEKYLSASSSRAGRFVSVARSTSSSSANVI
jgi:hypothetical protein